MCPVRAIETPGSSILAAEAIAGSVDYFENRRNSQATTAIRQRVSSFPVGATSCFQPAVVLVARTLSVN